MWKFVTAAAAALAIASTPAQAAPAEPVQVMVVGVFHMSNPGRDIANTEAPDPTSPQRQAEITRVVEGLNRFHPTAIATEWSAATVAERYPRYLAGTLPPSKNEVVLLGFRLGQLANARTVYGADMDGDFPFDAVAAYAEAHGMQGWLEDAMATIQAEAKAASERLARGTIGAELRYVNDPARLARGNAFYATALTVGGGEEQPGAELVAAWSARNYRICARIIQESKPGDRVVVFFGSGHAYLLRRCIAETPGFVLVEPNRYLPRR